MSKLGIYHGSRYIIDRPNAQYSRGYGDFGDGFYCTTSREFAGAWACRFDISDKMWEYYEGRGKLSCHGFDGYIINRYELDTEGLAVLDLDQLDTIQFISLLFYHKRHLVIKKTREQPEVKWLLEQSIIEDAKKADVILSSRWSDVWGSIFLRKFVDSEMTIQEFERYLNIANPGIVCLKSQAACDRLIGTSSYTDVGEAKHSYYDMFKRSIKDPYDTLCSIISRNIYFYSSDDRSRGDFLVDIAERAQ